MVKKLTKTKKATLKKADPKVIAQLTAFSWIGKVEYTSKPADHYNPEREYYTITTKNDVLLRTITKKAQVHEEGGRDRYVLEGELLDTPILVPIPALKIILGTRSINAGLASVPPQPYAIPHPLSGGVAHPNTDVAGPFGVCFGAYSELYHKADTWAARAEVAAWYMQSALPEAGSSQSPSAFMYFMARMPEEYVERIEEGAAYIDWVDRYYDEEKDDNGDDYDENW